MRIEGYLSTPEDWSIGISKMRGQDETGEIEMISFGFLLFSISLVWNT